MDSFYKRMMEFKEIGGDLTIRLSAAGVQEVFRPLIDFYVGQKNDHESFNKAFFYILMVYSRESEMLLPGVSLGELKGAVLKDLSVDDPMLIADLCNAARPAVYRTIRNYLDFQDNITFAHIVMLKELYLELRNSANGFISKGKDGGMDYDQKYKNHEYAGKIFEEISVWEQKLESENRSLTKQKAEIRSKKTTDRFTLDVTKFAKDFSNAENENVNMDIDMSEDQ